MAAVTAEYQKLVLDDINEYAGINHSVKASILERLWVRDLSPKKMHPNPEDEFCDASIGPNYEIVGQYVREYKYPELDKITDEPLIVEKMSTGGYMILNGHHRWLAAHRVGKKELHVKLVNATPLDEIYTIIKNSGNAMCVSIDLDEVLLTDGKNKPLDKKLKFPFNRIYKLSLRKMAPDLIKDLKKIGFDVWVYTGQYYSTEYINGLMSLHGVKVDGIVNGLDGKRSNAKIKEAFTQKYKYSLHIDDNMLICVDTSDKSYESLDINADEAGWASEVMKRLHDLQAIKALE